MNISASEYDAVIVEIYHKWERRGFQNHIFKDIGELLNM